MSEYENQVVSLIKFKSEGYPDRQDYLGALLRAADKWLQKHDSSGDIFDGWDNELADWFDQGIRAMNSKQTIPDFPDLELGEENGVPSEAEETDEDGEPDSEQSDDAEPEEAGTPDQPTNGTAPEPAGGEGTSDKPTPRKKAAKAKKAKEKSPYDDLSGAKDKFGIVIGTKTHRAVLMYEKGATAKDIDQHVGGKHYNILRKLAQAGHRVQKLPGGGFRVIHKDEVKD